MKKFYLMRHPELFQGDKYLKKSKNYFEGWYFKNTNNDNGISFIPGISIDGNDKKAFIQLITNNSSYYVNYSIDKFEYSYKPFYIKIGNNLFSKNGIHIDIKDNINNLIVFGDIEYYNSRNIKTSFFSPNIMGPFSYLPFMECNHAILCMKCNNYGFININDNVIEFDNDISYIEKDFGSSFPKSYVWCQGNNFQNTNASFMLSIADIPFKVFNFRGIICDLMIDDTEYKFATYNCTKIVKYDINDNFINIILKKGKYLLDIKSEYANGFRLSAPVKGKMDKYILESICSSVTVTLKKKKKTIFSDTSVNSGLEIVN